jgi:hypothetical protein
MTPGSPLGDPNPKRAVNGLQSLSVSAYLTPDLYSTHNQNTPRSVLVRQCRPGMVCGCTWVMEPLKGWDDNIRQLGSKPLNTPCTRALCQ